MDANTTATLSIIGGYFDKAREKQIPATEIDAPCLTTVGEQDARQQELAVKAIAKNYFEDNDYLADGMTEASFNNDLKQLFVIANDYREKIIQLKGTKDLEAYLDTCADYSAVTTKAMSILLREMNTRFETLAKGQFE